MNGRQELGGVGKATTKLMRDGNRCVAGESRGSRRASAGQLEDGRSGEFEERTWRMRSKLAGDRDGEQCSGLRMRESGCREQQRSRL